MLKTSSTWWAVMVPSRLTPVLTRATEACRGLLAMNSSTYSSSTVVVVVVVVVVVEDTDCARADDGFMPGMQHGDIMGHEFMGEVMEVGSANKKLKVGDRVVMVESRPLSKNKRFVVTRVVNRVDTA